MRRNDREIKDFEEKISMLKEGRVCSLCFVGDDYPYVIPLNYGFSVEDGQLYLYFHGSNKGTKYEMLAKNPKVAFNIVIEFKLKRAETACDFGADFQSLCGNGDLELLVDLEERKKALTHIAKHFEMKCSQEPDPNLKNPTFSDAFMKETGVMRLKVNEIIGKKCKK